MKEQLREKWKTQKGKIKKDYKTSDKSSKMPFEECFDLF